MRIATTAYAPGSTSLTLFESTYIARPTLELTRIKMNTRYKQFDETNSFLGRYLTTALQNHYLMLGLIDVALDYYENYKVKNSSDWSVIFGELKWWFEEWFLKLWVQSGTSTFTSKADLGYGFSTLNHSRNLKQTLWSIWLTPIHNYDLIAGFNRPLSSSSIFNPGTWAPIFC